MRHPIRAAALAAVCLAVLAGGPARAAAEELVDTSRLPRIGGARQIYASAPSTIFTTTASVADTADAAAKALAADGWRAYTQPFAQTAHGPTPRVLSFKRGAQALSVLVTVAPAQGNATSVSYTALVLANDLPVPADATDIAFDPDRPHLNCVTATPVDAALAFFRRELATLGWSLWSVKDDAKAAADAPAGEATGTGAHAFYVRDGRKPLLLTLQRGPDGRSKVEIKAVPPKLLIAVGDRDKPADTAEAAAARAAAKARADTARAAHDQMAGDILKQAGDIARTAIAEAMAGTKALPGPAHTGGKAAAAAPKAVPASAPPDLEAGEAGGMPVPKSSTTSGSERTPFRLVVNASVQADVAAVLAFYRRELGKRGWSEAASGAAVAPDRAVVPFTSGEGPAVLTLGRKGDETVVQLALRKPAEAAKAGILPKPGQAKLLFGNVVDTEAVITIDKRTVKVAAGAGAKKPDGPTLDLAPGKYRFSVRAGGKPAETDEVELGADEAWGIIIGPGGALALHAY